MVSAGRTAAVEFLCTDDTTHAGDPKLIRPLARATGVAELKRDTRGEVALVHER